MVFDEVLGHFLCHSIYLECGQRFQNSKFWCHFSKVGAEADFIHLLTTITVITDEHTDFSWCFANVMECPCRSPTKLPIVEPNIVDSVSLREL